MATRENLRQDARENALEIRYFKTREDALEEVARRRATGGDPMITRCETTPYGEYKVYSVPVELFVDDLIDPVLPDAKRNSFQLY